jgi:hypothetical protein
MKYKILNDRKINPFDKIRNFSVDKPLFKEYPIIKPFETTIETAEEFFYRFAEQPTYVSVSNDHVILEWHWPNKENPKMKRELVFKDARNLEWRTIDLLNCDEES